MAKLRVGVLRGGVGEGYENSIKTGEHILNNLAPRYQGVDILVSKDGGWHIWGMPITPASIDENVDVVFNALHGHEGESGSPHQVLQNIGLPYTGARPLADSLTVKRHLAKEFFQRYGIKSPVYRVVGINDGVKKASSEVFNSICPPWIIKFSGIGSHSVSIVARSLPELESALYRAFSVGGKVIVEEYIKGDDASCFTIDGLAGRDYFTLPVGGSGAEKELIDASRLAHRALGMRHYSRSHFINSPKRGVYILRVTNQPSLSEDSLLNKLLNKIKIPFSDFVDHVITLSRRV